MEGFHPFCRVCPGGKYSDFFQLSTCEKKKSLYIEKSLGEAVSSANVAQSVEQLTRNEQVIGSNPIIGSILDFFQRSPPPARLPAPPIKKRFRPDSSPCEFCLFLFLQASQFQTVGRNHPEEGGSSLCRSFSSLPLQGKGEYGGCETSTALFSPATH